MVIIIIIIIIIRRRRRRRRRTTTTTTTIRIRNKCTLIDVATPSDENTYTKVSKNLSKNKDLEIEITRMWHMKREIIPALEVINRGSEKLVREIPGNINNNNNNNFFLIIIKLYS